VSAVRFRPWALSPLLASLFVATPPPRSRVREVRVRSSLSRSSIETKIGESALLVPRSGDWLRREFGSAEILKGVNLLLGLASPGILKGVNLLLGEVESLASPGVWGVGFAENFLDGC
jgi:hypothetical protein